MKKVIVFLLSIFIVSAVYYLYPLKNKNVNIVEKEVSAPELLYYQKLEKLPILWRDVQNTEELKEIFKDTVYDKVPRIFVRNFPSDFKNNGNPALLGLVLLPHILRQNELLLAERYAFLALLNKLKNKQSFTQKEEFFWNNLVYKYEVLNPDKIGQAETLFTRIDRISPSLAIAQSIEATQNGKIHLSGPFDVRRWNDKKEYDFVEYDNLASAVADYALELNRGYSYLRFHMLRSAQQYSKHPLKGKIFARGLMYYKIEDPIYVQKLKEVFNWYKFEKLDEAQFERKN